MTLSLGLHHHQRSVEHQAEIREAKRMLRDRVRDDWDYPALPAWQVPARQDNKTAAERTVAGFRFHVHSDAEREGQDFEPLAWRERDYPSSDSDTDDDAVARQKSKEKQSRSEVTFEAPETVGPELCSRKIARKKRRRAMLEEEMAWNDGLSHYMARRDAWAGARTYEQIRALETRRAEDSASTSASAGSTPRSSTSSATAHSASTAGTSHDANIHIAGMTVAPPSDVLVPVVAQILPDHPIRKRISPAMYSEIYTKIILQSRTPSVPINLAPMVSALVQGWKDDGEWPPKPGPVEKSISRKKVAGVVGLKDGVRAVGRHLLGMSGGESLARDKG